jgi:hypothetical protein
MFTPLKDQSTAIVLPVSSVVGTKSMIFRRSKLAPVLLCIALAGCDKPIPNCDDNELRALVADMVENHYADQPLAPLAGSVVAEVDSIRTVSFSSDTKTWQCVGTFMIAGPSSLQVGSGGKTEIPFTISPSDKGLSYSVELKWP